MDQCKTAISPLLTCWGYCSLALSHWYQSSWYWGGNIPWELNHSHGSSHCWVIDFLSSMKDFKKRKSEYIFVLSNKIQLVMGYFLYLLFLRIWNQSWITSTMSWWHHWHVTSCWWLRSSDYSCVLMCTWRRSPRWGTRRRRGRLSSPRRRSSPD